jgi:hypothetical protein
MFDARHVTGAKSAISGEIPLEDPVLVEDDDSDDEEDESIKKKSRKRKSKATDDLSAAEAKNPWFRMYKKTNDAILQKLKKLAAVWFLLR